MVELAEKLIRGDRYSLARAITLVESERPEDRAAADALLADVWKSAAAPTIRLAVTGPPGAGKSTLIERIGRELIDGGRRVAVLAVDPSSVRSGGSILGDKTRMPFLSAHESAFVRPSPTAGRLGGVNRSTRESILLCEAAAFDTVIVETVGVGQSETDVADMVDYVLLLLLAGAGDELQGIKRGILEVADVLAVNKEDLDAEAARRARGVYRSAVSLYEPRFGGWRPPVEVISAMTGSGLDSLMKAIEDLDALASDSGTKDMRRGEQRVKWFHEALRQKLYHRLLDSATRGRETVRDAEKSAAGGTDCPAVLATRVLDSL